MRLSYRAAIGGCAVVVMFTPLQSLHAQVEPAAAVADSGRIAANWLKASMNGIRLSSADSVMAYRVCLASFLAHQRIALDDPERLEKLSVLDDKRDARLLQLLRTHSDSVDYLANSARFSFRRSALINQALR